MKKRILLFSIIFLTIFISVIIMSYNTNTPKTFTQDGVTYALTLDGASVNTFPSKGMYRVDVECSNATGKWLYDEWKLAVEDINGTNATCDVSFNTINTTYLNNYIIGLSGTTQGTGEVVNENGYRYEGKNPNNYIWFNNELWRIIGAFDEATHGVSGQNLVKIIRSDSIGRLAWSQSNASYWDESYVHNLLNGVYYNAENGTGGEYCYGYVEIPGNCDYTETGIKDNYRQMIENVTWYLGTVSSYSTTEEFYEDERNTTRTSEGYIGLMYPSDFGYSVLASSCARTTNLGDNLGGYDSAACAGQSWLYSLYSQCEWTIALSSSSSSSVFIVYYRDRNFDYCFYDGDAYNGYVRPVLYLDSSVYVYDGNGSQSDPYIIGM